MAGSHMVYPGAGAGGYCPPGIKGAADGLDQYTGERAKQQKVFCEPWFSAANLLGLAPAATLILAPNTPVPVFQTPVGGTGQGWPTQLDEDVTNFRGQNMLPAGVSFVAHAIGVSLDQIPPALVRVARQLVRFGIVKQEKYSNEWRMSALRHWPESSYGLSSPAASTSQPNTTIEYPQNGRLMAQSLPPGCELYFTALDQIQFTFRFTQAIALTLDGLPFNGIPFGVPGSNSPDPVHGVPIELIMMGTKFEQSAN